jgi:hypothetical protein
MADTGKGPSARYWLMGVFSNEGSPGETVSSAKDDAPSDAPPSSNHEDDHGGEGRLTAVANGKPRSDLSRPRRPKTTTSRTCPPTGRPFVTPS